MKRLTYRLESNAANLYDVDKAHGDKTKKSVARQNAFDLLAAYEDTGLTPEDVDRMRWIPVGEKLPKPGERVLMLMDGKSAYEGFICQSGKWDRYGNPVGTIEELFGCSVTHWMPLPTGPKENGI